VLRRDGAQEVLRGCDAIEATSQTVVLLDYASRGCAGCNADLDVLPELSGTLLERVSAGP